MSFWQRMQESLRRFMIGRHGPDELSLALLLLGMIVSLVGNALRLGLVNLLGMALYLLAIYRLFSKQNEKRFQENQKFLSLWRGSTGGVRQFIVRMKNRRNYKYFRCPECNARLRLPRKVGEVTITCGKCKHSFTKKA